MTKQEQIEEMAKIIDELYNVYDTTADEIAEGLYNTGYRKIPENAVVLTKEEYIDLSRNYVTEQIEQVRKETAKEILQRVVNICEDEEEFQDGTVNTQLEPMYFGIANGCNFIKGEVKRLAKEYGVEVEE